MARQKKLINKTSIPDYAIEKFARCVYPDIVAFFQSEEGQREFAEWQAEQAAQKAALKANKRTTRATAETVALVAISAAFSSVAPWVWKWEGCGSRWESTLPHNAGNKQIIRTHLPQGRTGSDYIALC